MSLLVPAVVARDSLRQAAGTSAGLSVEAFSVKMITVCAAPWNLGCSQRKGIWKGRGITIPEINRGKNDQQRNEVFLLT